MIFPLTSKKELDELYNRVTKRLKDRGVSADEKDILLIFHRVVLGVEYLNSRFTKWWTVVEDGEIDVGNPVRAPYNLFIDRSRSEMTQSTWPSVKDAQDNGFVSVDYDADRPILNEFWNEFVLEYRSDQVLQMMS